MKFNFKPSPNYRDGQSTGRIMGELTLGLLAVFAFSLYYYFTNFSASYGLRAILLMITAIVSACGTEILWCVFTKKDILNSLKNSYPWVTAIILTMMCPLSIEYYALAVATVIAIFFGKLVFGGFGQNIFNPAAVGRATIFASFAGAAAADIVTGATPTSSMAAQNWIINSAEGMSSFLKPFGGLGNMFVGLYPGAIGETSALVILVVGVILAIRKVIDWRVPATYLITVFVLAAGVGLMHGAPISYALFHLLTGGAMFGAVFMMTDPVTNPTSAAGRIMFAVGCAVITIVLRLRSNLPEGVMYSILIMNMLTPLIESLTDGQQIKMKSKNIRNLAILFVAGLAITLLVGSTIKPVAAGSAEAGATNGTETTYNVTQHGFQGDNQFEVVIDTAKGEVVSVKMTEFNDTPGIGDGVNDDYLSQFVGAKSEDDVNAVDNVSGASYTSKSAKDAIIQALNAGN